jgi:hypothetical protein
MYRRGTVMSDKTNISTNGGTISGGQKSTGSGDWWEVRDNQGNLVESGQDRTTKTGDGEYTMTRHVRRPGQSEVVQENKINVKKGTSEKSSKRGKNTSHKK